MGVVNLFSVERITYRGCKQVNETRINMWELLICFSVERITYRVCKQVIETRINMYLNDLLFFFRHFEEFRLMRIFFYLLNFFQIDLL